MEIKQSPQVSRTVEHVNPRRRGPMWLLIILIIVLVAVIVLLVLHIFEIGFFAKDQAPVENNQTETEETDQAMDTSVEFEVRPNPDPEDMTDIIRGRYNDPTIEPGGPGSNLLFGGPVTLVSVDGTESGALDETSLFTLDRNVKGRHVRDELSPNGQFLYAHELKPGRGESPATSYLSVIELESEKSTLIWNDQSIIYKTPVWTEDSSRLIFMAPSGSEDPTMSIHTYDLETGEMVVVQDATATGDDPMTMAPLAVRGDELFALRAPKNAEEPERSGGEFGVIDLDAQGVPESEFEVLFDLPDSNRGYDISDDGDSIVVARGSGDFIGGGEIGPFIIELFDRDTGELTEIRNSPDEKYSEPRFADDLIVYGTISGMWYYSLETGERINFVSPEELRDYNKSQPLRPVVVSPDAKKVVFKAHDGDRKAFDYYVAGIDPAGNLGEFERLDRDTTENIYGWTD